MRMEDIRQKAADRYEKLKARMRAKYALARELGFSAQEANLMTGWSEEKIREAAECFKREAKE